MVSSMAAVGLVNLGPGLMLERLLAAFLITGFRAASLAFFLLADDNDLHQAREDSEVRMVREEGEVPNARR